MIVVDASAMVEALLHSPSGARVRGLIADTAQDLHAPHLIDVEVAHALRRAVASWRVDVVHAHEALHQYLDVALERHDHDALLPRIWYLRDRLSAYDAAYVALAEALDAPLVTCDAKLAASKGHRAHIELLRA